MRATLSTDEASIRPKRIEGRGGVAQAWAVIDYGVAVIVKAGRNVVGNAGVPGADQPEVEAMGQLQNAGNIQTMPLIVLGATALTPQIVTIGRMIGQTRGVVLQVCELV